ncbi:hypothetical protein ABG768_001167 [Culter alburnus]|uniref:C-type lectin domain-containing protein n=1 Tax=Culter alburnus TaxID=194366 RepID=A0AAW2B870_CULAL
MTVCLGIICVVLLVSIIAQHISITAERESLFKSNKNTVKEFNQTINSLQDNYTDLMTEKDQLKNNFNSLSQKKMELETRVTSLSKKLETKAFKKDGLLISNKVMNWSDSRQHCRDRGADLVIIKTVQKQRYISSFIKDRAWIGLTDIQNEGKMKWLDNSPLKHGFWVKGEPNNLAGDEECVELNPEKPTLNNWNNLSCSDTRKWICEK